MISQQINDALTTQIIEPSKLAELYDLDDSRDEDPGFVEEIFDIFKESSPTHLYSLVEALKKNEPTKIVHASHKLRGSALNFGLSRLSAYCEVIEKNALALEEEERHLMARQLPALLNEAIMQFASDLETLKTH